MVGICLCTGTLIIWYILLKPFGGKLSDEKHNSCGTKI